MGQELFIIVDDYKKADYVSFDQDLNGITKDRKYAMKQGLPIAINPAILPVEYYFINDHGNKQTDTWFWIPSKLYKQVKQN